MAEFRFSGAMVVLGLVAQIAAQPCDPHWSDEFPYGGVEGTVHALLSADLDGPGGQDTVLYAGFTGETAGGIAADHIARWDGQRWAPLGKGVGEEYNTSVNALAVYDEDGDGPAMPALFAGGNFTTAGGQAASCIASWNGEEWSAVGGGLSGVDKPSVNAMRVIDEDGPGPGGAVLIVGGSFLQAGGTEAHFIARWNGTEWSPLGSGVDKPVLALEVFDDDGGGPRLPALYAGGEFQSAGGKQVNRLARWDGQGWEKWESGLTGKVTSMAVMDDDGDGPLAPALYVGGNFKQIGGTLAGIGRWDGHAWDDMNGGAGGVSALGVFDPDGEGPAPKALFVSGGFSTAGGVEARHIARWDGQAWSEPDGPMDYELYAFASFDPDGGGPSPALLYGGGYIQVAGNARPQGIVSLADGRWVSLGAGFDGNSVTGLVSIKDEQGETLYAAGRFGTANGQPADRVARLEDQGWVALGSSFGWYEDIVIGSLDADGAGPEPPALYAAGGVSVDGNASYILARRADEDWVKVADLEHGADELLEFDEDGAGPLPPALFVGGHFSGAIWRWDGQSLTKVGGGLDDGCCETVYAMATFDPDGPGPQAAVLVAGGRFDFADGAPASNVAAWDGSHWSALGSGLGSTVYDLCAIVHRQPGQIVHSLYASGQFDGTVARWLGSEWEPLNGPVGDTMTEFDPDGPGPAPPELYLGGGGGFSVVRYTGTGWFGVGGGTNGSVDALAVLHDVDGPSLFAAGNFTVAGGQSAGHIARLLCPGKTCYADCLHDDALDLFDYVCFINRVNQADPDADCDGSGGIDLFDFLCFVNLLNAGCP